ncbi:MAG: hypothetical protein FJ242_10245 [Nitrospira sp.]|nr:hypothetical protein [Nitrospira sp.]
MIKVETFKIAQKLCSVNTDEETVTFTNSLDDLHAQLSMSLLSLRAAGLKNLTHKRLELLANALSYLSLRFIDLTLRLQLMDWFWYKACQNKTQDDLFFHAYAPLFIKDFHIDVSSMMDAIAPIVILATQDLKEEDKIRLPSFSDVLPESKRSYREHLPNDLRAIVDERLRWWPNVKKIRDIVAHRDHLKLVFGPPTEGKLFQVYDQKNTPQILDEVLLYKSGHNVVNFEKYASFLWAELLVLLDRLGQSVANHTKYTLQQISSHQTKLMFIVRSWYEITREIESSNEI